MPSHSDCFIFVTGVVGRALGSGKFEAEHIKHLTQTAYDAFCEVFGEPIKTNLDATREAASRVADAPASSGPQRPDWRSAVPQSSGGDVPAETTPLDRWGGDKAYIGAKDKMFEGQPERDVCWGVWAMAYKEGNPRAKALLQMVSKDDPNSGDPQWHANNRKRIARAKAILAMK